jgi:hypothetical protein
VVPSGCQLGGGNDAHRITTSPPVFRPRSCFADFSAFAWVLWCDACLPLAVTSHPLPPLPGTTSLRDGLPSSTSCEIRRTHGSSCARDGRVESERT